ncbi:hypothetical protein FJ656_31345, partial [Schumannella luteola]
MAEPTDPNTPTEPEVVAPATVEPVSAAEHVGVDPVVPEVDEAEVVDDVAEPVVVEPEPVVVTAEPVVEAAPAAVPVEAREVVYVQAPTPPTARHNRGFGVLISLLGAAAFALAYLGVVAILIALTGASVDSSLPQFLTSLSFWVPVGVYAVFACLFALIVNRAAWWAHVLGSLFVAILTYAISGGII